MNDTSPLLYFYYLHYDKAGLLCYWLKCVSMAMSTASESI